MTIALGSDHAGFEMRRVIKTELERKGYECREYGCADGERFDYPVAAKDVCKQITAKTADFGVLVCGTGIGISIAANKIKGIRAAVCTDTYMAKATRRHNNANVLCLGARVTGDGLALEIVDAFLDTGFEGGRHQNRIDMFEG
jgi:ribose 5-phosphate isomerase B